MYFLNIWGKLNHSGVLPNRAMARAGHVLPLWGQPYGMRHTKVRLDRLAQEGLLANLSKATIVFKPTFCDSCKKNLDHHLGCFLALYLRDSRFQSSYNQEKGGNSFEQTHNWLCKLLPKRLWKAMSICDSKRWWGQAVLNQFSLCFSQKQYLKTIVERENQFGGIHSVINGLREDSKKREK